MHKYVLRPSSKNQVTIPKGVRDALGVKPREPFTVVVKGNQVTLEPLREYTLDELDGILPALDPPPSLDFDAEIMEAQEEMAEKAMGQLGDL